MLSGREAPLGAGARPLRAPPLCRALLSRLVITEGPFRELELLRSSCKGVVMGVLDRHRGTRDPSMSLPSQTSTFPSLTVLKSLKEDKIDQNLAEKCCLFCFLSRCPIKEMVAGLVI